MNHTPRKNAVSKASLAGKLSAVTLAIGAMTPMLSACSHGQDNDAAKTQSAQQASKAAPSNPCAPQAGMAGPSNPCAPQAQAAPSNPCAPQSAAPASSTKQPSNPCAPQGGNGQG